MTRHLFLITAAVFLSLPALADERPLVIFFGGHGSTASQMRSWRHKAQSDPKYGKVFEFQSVAYPKHTSPDENEAVSHDAARIENITKEINAHPNRKVIIVGHSSGAALAAKVIEKVQDRKRTKLVILDDGIDPGFPQLEGFDREHQLQCWSASNGQLNSPNIGDTKKLCGGAGYHEIAAPECKTSYCLHFKLVNENADPNLNEKTYAKKGYSRLRPNLRWLEFALPEPEKAADSAAEPCDQTPTQGVITALHSGILKIKKIFDR